MSYIVGVKYVPIGVLICLCNCLDWKCHDSIINYVVMYVIHDIQMNRSLSIKTKSECRKSGSKLGSMI